MSEKIVKRAAHSLGKGFDITSDFRLKFCKGKSRIVQLNDSDTRDLDVPGFGPLRNISIDIKCDKGDRTRYQSDILQFHQMSEFYNKKCSISGKIPSGLFNASFQFQSDKWAMDASNTKYLGLDGYFIVLFSLHIDRYPLVLADEVRDEVPATWDPCALARFIEKYGTHIIVGLSIGGQDVVLVRQEKSSKLGPSELKTHLEELGDQLFSGSCTFSPLHGKANDSKLKAPRAFNIFDPQDALFNSHSSISTKDGITVICSKKGGNTSANSHCEWLLTVPSKPDAIHFSFIPITSLLNGVPGRGYLYHAINLYLRYKPPIGDLAYFLDFQTHKIWAPVHSDHPLGPPLNRAMKTPSLQSCLMGPKLYVNTTQVAVGRTPVTGMRLFLEGMKCDRLAIHLQHLSSTPTMLQNKINSDGSTWRGSEETSGSDTRYLEPIQSKRFSHVCTASVKYDPSWATEKEAAFIVTGARLHVKKHNSRNVLHLRFSYSRVSDYCIVQSCWKRNASEFSQKSGFFSALSMTLTGGPEKEKHEAVVLDSAVFPTGPPSPAKTPKLLKFVDVTEMCKGPQDSPGHWLVTGGRLQLEKGKICMHVKFSLLNVVSS